MLGRCVLWKDWRDGFAGGSIKDECLPMGNDMRRQICPSWWDLKVVSGDVGLRKMGCNKMVMESLGEENVFCIWW